MKWKLTVIHSLLCLRPQGLGTSLWILEAVVSETVIVSAVLRFFRWRQRVNNLVLFSLPEPGSEGEKETRVVWAPEKWENHRRSIFYK